MGSQMMYNAADHTQNDTQASDLTYDSQMMYNAADHTQNDTQGSDLTYDSQMMYNAADPTQNDTQGSDGENQDAAGGMGNELTSALSFVHEITCVLIEGIYTKIKGFV